MAMKHRHWTTEGWKKVLLLMNQNLKFLVHRAGSLYSAKQAKG